MFPLETLPPEDPSGRVGCFRIVLSPEQAFSIWVFLNKVFYREGLSVPRPNPKLEDHRSSIVRDCLFNLFAAIFLILGRICDHDTENIYNDIYTGTRNIILAKHRL